MAKIRNSGTIINTDYQFAKLIDGSITNAVIPSSVSIVKTGCFSNMSKIEYAYVPKNVKQLGQSAFSSCTSLKKIEFADNSVVSMGPYTFQNCSQLETIELPIGLTSIGAQSFASCTALKKVIIPETLSAITNVFPNLVNLSYVFIRGDTQISTGLNGCSRMRLIDMRNTSSVKNNTTGITANEVYLYINVPEEFYTGFTEASVWSSLKLKHFVHSCDKATFEEIENPIDGDYYSLKGDTNYLNPLGEKQIIIKQFANGEWIEIDIDT